MRLRCTGYLHMMRACLFFIIGALPLGAQTSFDDAARVNQTAAPASATVAPDSATPSTSYIAPLTNSVRPQRPASSPQLAQLTVTPGTIREGLTYSEAAKTTVTLSAPATREFTCSIRSSDPQRMACGDITFLKGEQQKDGVIQIIWKNITHDYRLKVKAYDAANPEMTLQARIYLRKKVD